MAELELKPCPFCGETNPRQIITRGMNERYFISHFDDVFNIKSSIGFETEAGAVEAWNRRVDNDKL